MYDASLGRFISEDPIKGSMLSSQSQNPYVYCMNNPLRFVDPTGMMGDIPRMSLDEWLGPSYRSASDLLNEMRASQEYFSGLIMEAYHDIMFGSGDYWDYVNNVVLPGSPKHVYENKLDIAGISINYIQSPNDGRNVADLTVRVPISLSSFDIAEIITSVAFPYSFLMPNLSGHETSFNTLHEYDTAIMNRPSITSPIMPITITDIRTEVTVMCVTSDTRLKEGSVSLFTIFGVQTSGEIFRTRVYTGEW